MLSLLAAAAAVYWPALGGSYIWDDDAHVTTAALASWSGLGHIWTVPGATQQYYPLLHTAFWLEHRLWGDAAVGYHLLNLALHVWSAWLFVRVLEEVWRMGTPWDKTVASRAAWLGGLLFALHPVAVESVAWIAEQKNTLSAVFYLSAGLVYLRGGKWAGATSLFVCALLTKSVTATLPAALLVLIWYRRGRLSLRHDVLPLVPWFVLAAGAGLFTAWVEHTLLGASGADFDLSLLARGLLATRIAAFYLGRILWPFPLIFMYPRWTISAADPAMYAYPIGWAALIFVLVRIARRGSRGPLATALYFLGTLFPALGFFNVYPFLFSYVADHFQYLAMLGPVSAAAAGWALWRARDPSPRPLVAAAVGLAVLAGLSIGQAKNYTDAETLYRSVLARNSSSWMALYNLGVTLHRENRIAEAAQCYERATDIRPNFPQAQNNLGVILIDGGQSAEAIPHLETAILAYTQNPRLAAELAEAESNLGRALQQTSRDREATGHFARALSLGLDRPELRNNYAVALIRCGRPDDAEREFRAALQRYPNDQTARENLTQLEKLKAK